MNNINRDGLTEAPLFPDDSQRDNELSDIIDQERKARRRAIVAQVEQKVGKDRVDNVLSSMDQMTNSMLELLANSSTVDPDSFTTALRDLSNIMQRRVSSGPSSVRLAITAADAFLEDSAPSVQRPAVLEVVKRLTNKFNLNLQK